MPSAPPGSADAALPGPPPLPQQIQRFRLAAWIGLASGGLFALFLSAASVWILLTPIPGRPPEFAAFLAPLAAIFQALCAFLLLRGRSRVLLIFCVSSILLAFFLLLIGGVLFAVINLVPIALILYIAAPKSAQAAGRSHASDTPVESREDLFAEDRLPSRKKSEDLY